MPEKRGRPALARLCACLAALLLALMPCAQAQEADFSPPTQPEEIAEWIEEAMGVYAWFTIWPLAGDLEQPLEEGVSEFYRVLDERYDTRLKLAEFALQYFSMEIVTGLFDRGLYQEAEGVLYVSDRFCIADENISAVTFELAEQGEDWIVYRANVSYLEGTDEAHVRAYDYRCEQTGGQWVFTEFAFYWEGEWSFLDG